MGYLKNILTNEFLIPGIPLPEKGNNQIKFRVLNVRNFCHL